MEKFILNEKKIVNKIEIDKMKIGQLIKELRKEKGLTQEQLAEVFQLSDRTVSRWERGKNIPDLGVLICLSEFFNVELIDLIMGEKKCSEAEKDISRQNSEACDNSCQEKSENNKERKNMQLMLNKLSRKIEYLFLISTIIICIGIIFIMKRTSYSTEFNLYDACLWVGGNVVMQLIAIGSWTGQIPPNNPILSLKSRIVSKLMDGRKI